MPRFVIQRHSRNKRGQVHWDLMLEKGDSLATWQVEQQPGDWGNESIPCQKIFEHRLKYLTYEGPIRPDRGEVLIVGAGQYQVWEIREDYWKVSLAGDAISGFLELERVKEDQWMLTFQGK